MRAKGRFRSTHHVPFKSDVSDHKNTPSNPGTKCLVGFGTLFFLRVGREERMMLEAFGDDYLTYMARATRVIPWMY